MRITRQTYAAPTTGAVEVGIAIQRILDESVGQEHRRRFFDRVAVAFRALREDPIAWHEEQAARTLWDRTLGAGLAGDL
jgi:hypothetical protein